MGESFKSNEISNRPMQWWGPVDVQFLEVWHGQFVYCDASWGPFAPGRRPQEANS
jgi:hypothetical protein